MTKPLNSPVTFIDYSGCELLNSLDISTINRKVIHDMLGFADIWVFLGYVLTLASLLFCLIYGIVFRHSGVEEKDGDYRAEIRWEREEIDLIEKLP